jgi:sporadic carbohydrate cluster protein (TIGR04323 family)
MIFIYTSMRPMGALRISSRDQNDFIRSYCSNNSIGFSLPFPEFVFPRCHIQLYSIIADASANDIIIFYSSRQLNDYLGSRDELCKLLLSRFSEIHFAYEQTIFKRENGALDEFRAFVDV